MAAPVAAVLVKTKVGKWIAGGVGGILTFIMAALLAPFVLISFLVMGAGAAEHEGAGPSPSSTVTPIGGVITKKGWTNPAPAAVIATSPFGYRCGALSQCDNHSGYDLGAGCGTPAVAANAGTVTYASWQDGGGGNVVIVDHGGSVYTWYAHLAEFKTSVGQKVKAGQQVGVVGTTGASSGCHLHFEVRTGGDGFAGVAQDPVPFMASMGVTLPGLGAGYAP